MRRFRFLAAVAMAVAVLLFVGAPAVATPDKDSPGSFILGRLRAVGNILEVDFSGEMGLDDAVEPASVFGPSGHPRPNPDPGPINVITSEYVRGGGDGGPIEDGGTK